MISDITLGQYFPGFSVLHKLDPRTKIISAMLFIVTVFLAQNPASFLFLLAFVIGLVLSSRLSIPVLIKGIKPVVFILIFTSFINLFLTKGSGDPLLSFYFINIYTEGIYRAIFMSLRVILLINGTSMLLSYTTSPISLTDGIESLLAPLKKIKVPVHSFAMMMSIALRFIPTLVEETEKIMNAQKSRGADFSSGGLVKRAKSLIPLLVPLFVSSFKRADELATAMECRCYRGDKNRTKLVKLEYKAIDFACVFIYLILLGVIITARILPYSVTVESIIYNVIFFRI